MSFFIEKIREEPQTHILIIGVGGYPYLNNGIKSIPQTFEGAQMLGQLSSPPVSAEAFYNAVMDLDDQEAWIRSIGSVEVLISPSPNGKPVFQSHSPDVATLANIKKSYREWKKRCDSNVDNVAIFFFCGHGLEKGEHYLLAEDFGEVPEAPWDGSFAFDMTRRAFFTCKARTQLFFVDACRQLTSDMLTTDLPMNPIEPPSILAKDCTYNLTQKASAANESAYGRKNEVSYYTKALIGALLGDAVSNDSSEWCVDTGRISSQMNSFLQKVAPGEGYPQRCISTTSDVTNIIRFKETPEVPLRVTCAPESALPLAELSYLNLDTNQGETRAPLNTPWDTKVKAGIYKVQAHFSTGQFEPVFVHKNFMPPAALQILNCMP
ncbi:caspase family protein [Cognataquiflexum aquatile]|uniref:caspase family protein n=1 Tax=Cognataquiflexum aquatile TaxID=2249427 RepID=UPI000DEB9F20|nr:caspase family protein [Cognataquiflexum aquatile]